MKTPSPFVSGLGRTLAVVLVVSACMWLPASAAAPPGRSTLAVNLHASAATHLAHGWFHGSDHLGIPMAAGVDDLALAMTADGCSRRGRSRASAFAASRAPIRDGLVVLPDRAMPAANERTLPALQYGPGRPLFDQVLASTEARYGRSSASGVALALDYPRAAK